MRSPQSTAQPATAADIPVKAPPPVVEVWTWDGWYTGVNGGYSWGRSKTTASFYNAGTGALLCDQPADHSTSTVPIFGGQIGFNRQRGNWVWGVEADGAMVRSRGQHGNFSLSRSGPRRPL